MWPITGESDQRRQPLSGHSDACRCTTSGQRRAATTYASAANQTMAPSVSVIVRMSGAFLQLRDGVPRIIEAVAGNVCQVPAHREYRVGCQWLA